MKTVTYFTKPLLQAINNRAIRDGRNQALHPDFVDSLPDLRFPIVFSMVHNGCEMRARVVLDRRGNCGLLDMSFEDFASLPVADLDTNDVDEIAKA